MSSEQQLDVPIISVAIDSCPNNTPIENLEQCNYDDGSLCNAVLENEPIISTNSAKGDEDENDHEKKAKDNCKPFPTEDNLNCDSLPEQATVVDTLGNNRNNIEDHCASDGHSDGDGASFRNGNVNISPALDNEATNKLSVSDEQPVDTQTPNEPEPPQASTSDHLDDRVPDEQAPNLSSTTENTNEHPCLEVRNTDSNLTENHLLHIPSDGGNRTAEPANASHVVDDDDFHRSDNDDVHRSDNDDAHRNDNDDVHRSDNNDVHRSENDDVHRSDNDDLSNDENENCSNEHDSSEDNNEFPDIVDFDGTTEVENEEYILDTVVRKQPRHKERRRIRIPVNDDDDDSDDIEMERKRLQSPSPPRTVEENQLNENVNNDEDDEEEEDIEHLMRTEKPGPKSKKISTQKMKELQARELLRNVVVIPSSSSKKKKNRIIDSDDDDGDGVNANSLFPYMVDVDDIGLPDTTEDNDDNDTESLVVDSILLNDIDKLDEIENSNRSSATDVSAVDENDIKAEPTIENKSVECSSHDNDINGSSVSVPGTKISIPEANPVAIKEESFDATKNVSDALGDSYLDSAKQKCHTENDDHSAIADFPSFSSSSSSENEDEFIPNDVYFGTPDHNKKRSSRGKGARCRGRPVQSATRNDARSTPRQRQRITKRRASSTSDSASSSSERNAKYTKAKPRRKPETFTIVQQPSQLYQNNKFSAPSRSIQKQKPQQQQQIQRRDHRKRDRFYDKSQDIPNSIYFGEVDVPLHVLYASDSDSDNDKKVLHAAKFVAPKSNIQANRFSSQVSRGQGRTVSNIDPRRHQSTAKQLPNSGRQQKAYSRPKINSAGNDRSIEMMKKFFKAAGLGKVKLSKLWEGCKSNEERVEKMLELLREKGLEGEPTISKCRQLKVDYLTKKEIEDLDPNVIIQTEGRTTRRSTRAATKRQYTYDEDEIMETRTKLRKVIDSDSDF